MKIRTPREKRILYIKNILRWIITYAVIFICFLIMTSGTWLKPVLLVPAAVAVALANGQLSSAFTGAVCGYLIDIAGDKVIGTNAVILTVFSVVISLLYEYYLRNKFVNYMIITAVVSYVVLWLDYKFYYEMWEYEYVERIFAQTSMKVWAYTIVSAVVIYFIFELINHYLMPKNHVTIEEAVSTAVQTGRH
ncbi:MAG: hypothetical protein MJ081_02465 [Ruminococcus sp.]|nr:hypothetical protein [Ruminococcus sp.]